MSNNHEEQAIYTLYSRTIRTLKEGQTTRWEDDGQGGGELLKYTPGETKCWRCRHVINEDGECHMDGDRYYEGGCYGRG